jgi:DDE family transposase
MVKFKKSDFRKNHNDKELNKNRAKAKKINASTQYDTCSEQLSPFGGLLPLIKFLDLVDFQQMFDFAYRAPTRKPKLGHYSMMLGLLMLLFIGFNRIWHFSYLRLDAMLCGFFNLTRLPVASTFWRYVNSLGINQAQSLLELMTQLRKRAWKVCDVSLYRVCLDIDTTVETVFGHQQGARKGHNTKHRGKKAYRPVLCFIEQTREYLLGKLRKGETISGKETAAFIAKIKGCLPDCVQQVLIRADAEFQSWESVYQCIQNGFNFVIANKRCNPPFDPKGWYRPKKRQPYEYNSCIYQPMGWLQPVRFVAMRMPKEKKDVKDQLVQSELFEDDWYKYRIFCTDLKRKAHMVIAEYDKRADVENLVGESKREGLDAIPSSRFKNNYAYFQIVILAYNVWRYLKMMAEQTQTEQSVETEKRHGLEGIKNNTVRIARLRLLMIAAKVVTASNRDKVRYSVQDSRTPALMSFLKYLDLKRSQSKPWGLNPQEVTAV